MDRMTETTHPRAALPPGQRQIDFFPRFGRRLSQPPPIVPARPTVVFGGALTAPIEVALDELVGHGRRELRADFHCVAGWSVTGLSWEGVAFADVYERYVAPAVAPGTTVTHLRVRGLDGEHFVAELDDLLADLRVKPGSRREECLQGLLGYALKQDESGLLFVPALVEAFADAVSRSKAGAAGASARWKKPDADASGDPSADF